jgi:hypothetical protein
MNNKYYVYLYLRPDGTPYYVGKGKNYRAFKIANRRMKPPSDKSRIIFHAENLTEDQAFTLEKELIAKYGRKDTGTGILRNLTDGGEGMSGFIYSDETKANRSRSQRSRNASSRIIAGLFTPETKAKRIAGIRAYYTKKKLEQSESIANLEPFFMST